jgi:tRNA threonylcarbamoyladenosine biosynthesis protein TsaB
VLAIDTSTQVGGVALSRGGRLLGEDTWQAGGHQTQQVLPAAARLWERAGYTVRDLALVVVATGPGSFTGLRVGLSLAKGLCLPLEIPLVGVPTLDALAYQAAGAVTRSGQLKAVLSAGRGMYYVGTYRVPRGQLRREGEFGVVPPEELAALVSEAKGDVVVAGELEGAELPLDEKVRVAAAELGVRRAGFLVEVGRWVLATQGAAEAALLQPLYLRRAPAA